MVDMLLDIRVFAFADGTDYGAARCCPSGRFPRLASLEVMTWKKVYRLGWLAVLERVRSAERAGRDSKGGVLLFVIRRVHERIWVGYNQCRHWWNGTRRRLSRWH